MKQWRAPLFAGLAFLIAFSAWLYDERRQLEAAEEQLLQESVFGIASADEVTRLILVNPEDEIEGERRGEDWWLMNPTPVKGDNDAFRVIVENFIFARRRNEFAITGAVALSNYGLEQPGYKLTLEAEGSNAETRTVLVGDQTGAGDYYAMLEGGETIFILSAHLRNNLIKTPLDLRNRRVFAFDIERATALSVANTSGTFRLAKRAELWRYEEPAPFPAETALVESFLAEISNVQVIDFVDTQTLGLSAYGLDPPQATIDIMLDEALDPAIPSAPKHLKILLGERAYSTDHRWATADFLTDDNGRLQIVQLPSSFWEMLGRDQRSYRRQGVFTLAFEELDKVDVQTGAAHFAVAKAADGVWRFQDSSGMEIDQEELEMRLGLLLDLTVKGWVTDSMDDLTSFGLTAPLARISLSSASQAATETLAVGDYIPTDDFDIYARLEQHPAIFTLDSLDMQKFFLIRGDFELKKLFTFDPQQVTKVRLTGFNLETGETSFIVLEKTERTWKMQIADAQELLNASPVLTESLINQFAELRFEQQLDRPPLDAASMGLTSPTLTMTAYDAAGDVLGGFERGPNKGQFFYLRRHDGKLFHVSINRYLPFQSALGTLLNEYRRE